MSLTCQEALGILRAHYDMLGPMPDPKPYPIPFHKALLAALETNPTELADEEITPFEIFCQLPVLLVINGWDHSDFLMPMMSPKTKGRLRFVGAVAQFCSDFDHWRFPWWQQSLCRVTKLR